MQWIGYLLLQFAAQLFRFVPFGALYAVSDGLAWLLFRVFGYRRAVVLDHLKRVFPEKTEEERLEIARRSYQNLTDLILETLKSFTCSLEEINRRCPCLNPELVNRYLDNGQSVIISGSHYNNWELACLTIPAGLHGLAVTVYKPLSNKIIDAYFNKKRARGKTWMLPMDEVFSAMRKSRNEAPAAWLFLADQSPSSKKSAHWVSFLGQDSASLPGVDVLARKFNYPVLYFHLRRLKRGCYELEYADLWPDPATASEGDITRAYARVVEQEIYAEPWNWLWSHKRWKISRNN